MATLVSWAQTTLNTVDLVLGKEPEHLDPAGISDGLNLDNYAVMGPTTPYPVRLLQYVEYIADNTLRLWFDGELVPGETYEVQASGLLAYDGTPFTPNPMLAEFTAYGADVPVVPIRFDKTDSFDLANPQLERDSQGHSMGTLSVDEQGDLTVEGRRASLRKRVLRRCTSRPGGFAHLENYGLRIDSKTLIRPADLRRLQQDAEAQVSMEPDVVSVRAIVRQLATGGAWLTLKVRAQYGEIDVETTIGGDE